MGSSAETPSFVPGEVLVQFAPGVGSNDVDNALASIGAQVSQLVRGVNAQGGPLALAALPPGLDPAQAAQILSHLPGISFAEPNWILSITSTATDPAFTGGQLWGMEGDATTPANPYGSQAGEAWLAGYTGSTKVGVGVVDTGIDYTHADLYRNIWLNSGELPAAFKSSLQDTDGDGLVTFRDLNASANASYVSDLNGNGRIDAGDLLNDARWENGADDDLNGYTDDLVGWDFANNDNNPYDDNSHGTHVSGTIGATANDGGVVGVNWAVELVALKFLNAQGSGTTADAIRALDYLTNASKAGSGVDFAASNNSWGGDAFSQLMLDAIVRGAQQDILFVAAAGNGNFIGIGQNNDSKPFYPASYSTLGQGGLTYDAVISVAAITSTGSLATFSNYGMTSVDLGAPGNSIYSTVPGGYGTKSGTSMATPHVTGAIALYTAAAGAGVSAAAIKQAILSTVAPTSSLLDKTLSDGRLDIGHLLSSLDQTPPTTIGAISDAFDNQGVLTGAVANGGSTDDTSPLLEGTLSANLAADETLLVFRDGVALGSASASGAQWTYQDNGVSGGAHQWIVKVVDQAGNAGPASAPFALTITAPNEIYGTAGNDTLVGTAGDDKIWGVPKTGSNVGRGSVDQLTGADGADIFVLGDSRGRFYDDGNSKNAGASDYARITDFDASEGDKIQLAGVSSRYLTHAVTINNQAGIGIYYDTNNSGSWNPRDELIGFVPGVTTLNSGDFLFV